MYLNSIFKSWLISLPRFLTENKMDKTYMIYSAVVRKKIPFHYFFYIKVGLHV